jgi:hypothetical protein
VGLQPFPTDASVADFGCSWRIASLKILEQGSGQGFMTAG